MPEPAAEPAPTPEPGQQLRRLRVSQARSQQKPQERAFSLAVNAVPLVLKSQRRGPCRCLCRQSHKVEIDGERSGGDASGRASIACWAWTNARAGARCGST